MILELKSLLYEARLKKLNLTTFEIRRIRGDLIEVYKILNGHLDIIKYFFTQRMIDYWNAPPQTAIDAENISHQLNVHLYNIIRGFKQAISFLPLAHSSLN